MPLKVVVFVVVALAVALVPPSMLLSPTDSNEDYSDFMTELEVGTPEPVANACLQAEMTKFNEEARKMEENAQKLCQTISGINDTLKGLVEKFADGFKTLSESLWPRILSGDIAGSSGLHNDVKTRSCEIVKNITAAADESKNTDLNDAAENLKKLLKKWEKDEKDMTNSLENCINAEPTAEY